MDVKLIFLVSILICLTPAAYSIESSFYLLVNNGKPKASIVLQKDVSPLLRSAVEDLVVYIEKASGGRMPVVEDGTHVEGQAIHIGLTTLAKQKALPLANLSPDAFILAKEPEALIICGCTDDGTINGIYTLLRDEIGVRWFMPGELWEVVPKKERIAISAEDGRSIYEPDFPFRIWSGILTQDGAQWATRNRLTRPRQGIPYYGFGHNLKRIFPVSKYGKDHPEYYAEIKGERFVPPDDESERSQPCFTNPDVIRITVETAREYFDKNPDASQFSLCVNDNADFCACAECSKLDTPPVICGHGWRTYSDSYFYYVEQVAKELAKSHPGKTLGCYAYWAVESLPRHIQKLPDNVVICLTQDTSQHFDPKYREYDRQLYLGWNKVAAHVAKYDYYGLGWFSPRYFPHLAAEDIKFSRDHGVAGLYCEVYPYWAITSPQLYMAAQLLWETESDPDALLNEYFSDLYEESAPTMKEFYSLLEQLWMKKRQGRWFQGLDRIDTELINFDAAGMTQALGLLDKARRECSGTARKRVEDVQKHFRFSYTITAGYDAAIKLRTLPLENRNDFEQAVQEIKRVLRLARLAESIYITTLKVDPLYQHAYYMDSGRFWQKFDGWEEHLLAEVKTSLGKLDEWLGQNMKPDESARIAQDVVKQLSAIEIRKKIDFEAAIRVTK